MHHSSLVASPPADPGAAEPAFWRPTLSAGGALTVAALPAFLLGAFAPEIKADLGFGETGLGVVFASGYLVSASVLQFGGRLADRRGPRVAIRLGMILAVIGFLGFATVASSIGLVMVAFAFNRACEAVTQPATNTMMSQGVVEHRRGAATGLKQAAIPLSTMLAGLAVPLLGDSLGWRLTFGIVAFLTIPVWFALPNVAPPPRRTARSLRDLATEPHLRFAAIGGFFAAAAVVTASGFLVSAAEDAGFAEDTAGLLLAAGGAVMIVSRISWGLLADRIPFDKFRAVAGCLAVGVGSFVCFAVGTKPAMVLGTLLLFAAGWSWPGLFLYAVLQQHPEAPGAATSLVQTGIRLGALASPILFGWLADAQGFRTAWLVPIVSASIATAFILATSRSVTVRSTGRGSHLSSVT